MSGRRVGMMRAVADTLTEQEATRRIFFAAGGLVLLGIVLLVGTVLWWRSTRPESSALAPLEVMSTRRWATASETERKRLADQVRPEGGAPAMERPDPVPVEFARDVSGEADRFDDLRELDELLGTLTGSAATVAVSTVDGDAEADAERSGDVVPEVVAGLHVADADVVDAHVDPSETTTGVETEGAIDELRRADGNGSIAIDPLLRMSRPD